MLFRTLVDKVGRKVVVELGILIQEANTRIAYKMLPRFGNNPQNTRIDLPRRIINAQLMFLGDNVWLGPGSLLIASTRYPGPAIQNPELKIALQHFSPKIEIGNRVTSTADLQITAHHEVIIEDDVLFASNVHIEDGSHGYLTATMPYKYQPMSNIAPVIIKRGSWIGQNVVILPGVTIGECSIIGANSVVTTSIPERCIAVGAPARVIKRWDDIMQRWVVTTGSFANTYRMET